VDNPNSQKKSPRNSAKSEKNTANMGDEPQRTRHAPAADDEDYMDRSADLVTRVRVAREAAQREMESFGDPSEYDITIIHGQKKDDPLSASQSPLNFETGEASETN
jgi:hypothetical protein